ncbi:hypothetical protein [Streptomyces sp. V2I9]|uniref:hypothetical protein n=2 Tax=unclassified Streptomyces TaxID=2593676 RepID=UPI00278A6DD7|nr:hypothetical protein [Streptomyces sp. V2I9]MDQ0986026.1 hypothetical protein [Streptomyces sp. V2I9]
MAARIGAQAVGIAAETGSARIFEQLDRLDQALAPAVSEDGVAEFRGALDRIILQPARPLTTPSGDSVPRLYVPNGTMPRSAGTSQQSWRR